jgi:hypothetical protein
MMAFRVRILPTSTIRLHPWQCKPFNADFDGDEINISVLQNPGAIVEAMHMCSMGNLALHNGKPVFPPMQDALVGMHLTRTLTRQEYHCALMPGLCSGLARLLPPAVGMDPADSDARWRSDQLISSLLPADFDYETPTVCIRSGILVSGKLSAEDWSSAKGMLRLVLGRLSADERVMWYQAVHHAYMQMADGFSVGLEDCMLPDIGTARIKYDTLQAVDDMYEDDTESPCAAIPGMTSRQSLEYRVRQALFDMRSSIERAVKLHTDNHYNALRIMSDAGSKGSMVNIVKIAEHVGQQITINGRAGTTGPLARIDPAWWTAHEMERDLSATHGRFKKPLEKVPGGCGRRALPHFAPHDTRAEAHGLCLASYIEGLSPAEFWAEAGPAREAGADTALGTPVSGYINRCASKYLEPQCIDYLHRTVTEDGTRIVQLAPFGDGLEPSNLYVSRDLLFGADNEFIRTHLVLQTGDELAEYEYERFIDLRDTMRAWYGRNEPSCMLPFDTHRLLKTAHAMDGEPTDPYTVLMSTNALIDELSAALDCMLFQQRSGLLCMLSLKSVTCWNGHCMSVDGFVWLLAEIREQFERSRIQPGERVGMRVALALGQPGTQMTMDTGHKSGSADNVGARNSLQTYIMLLSASKNRAGHGMTLFCKPDIAAEDRLACLNELVLRITPVSLGTLTECMQIFHYPVEATPVLVYQTRNPTSLLLQGPDKDGASDEYALMDEEASSTWSSWMMRLVLKLDILLSHNLSVGELVELLRDTFTEKSLAVIASMDGDECPVLHLRILRSTTGTHRQEEIDSDILSLCYSMWTSILREIHVSGVRGISNICVNLQGQPHVRSDPTTGVLIREMQPTISVRGLASELFFIDPRVNVTASHPQFVSEHLGIEAGAACMRLELRRVLETYGVQLDGRNIDLLVDSMTMDGKFRGTSRTGNRNNANPLYSMSFGAPLDVAHKAALQTVTDKVTSISAQLILGKHSRPAAADFDLHMTLEQLGLDGTQTFNDSFFADTPVPVEPSEEDVVDTKSPVYSPFHVGAVFSPFSPSASPVYDPLASPGLRAQSPDHAALSPAWGSSPQGMSPWLYGPPPDTEWGASPPPASAYFSPSSPSYSPPPNSPGLPVGPSYSPAVEMYSPTSPGFSPSHTVRYTKPDIYSPGPVHRTLTVSDLLHDDV